LSGIAFEVLILFGGARAEIFSCSDVGTNREEAVNEERFNQNYDQFPDGLKVEVSGKSYFN
jgi:hypothetical protein